MLRSDSSKLRDVGDILKSWCGDSAFGNFIDRETSVMLGKDLVAFDLKGLESFDELQTVCLYLITDLIWSNIQKDRYRMKFVVFDECWKLLKDKAGQEFIESIFRTCRKYYTSCIAISQAIQDFAESEISSAIVPNCSIKWLLQQGQSNSEAIKKHLGLNDNEVELVNGLRQKQGHFSEAYLLSGPKNRSVVTVEPTPLELWIATTNPKDLKIIEEKKIQSPQKHHLDILRELADEYPNGC
ncbi:MAG: ATP-binding protein [Bdellovibrionales bacterium]|nr:ATP-binding protein [Bdellovibrionales bacterium]